MSAEEEEEEEEDEGAKKKRKVGNHDSTLSFSWEIINTHNTNLNTLSQRPPPKPKASSSTTKATSKSVSKPVSKKAATKPTSRAKKPVVEYSDDDDDLDD